MVGIAAEVAKRNQVLDLIARQLIAGLDGSLAGHHVQQFIEQIGGSQAGPVGQQFVDNPAQHFGRILLGQNGGIAHYQHRVATKGLDQHAELGKFLGAGQDRRDFGWAEMNGFRHQEALGFQAACRDARFELFVQDPFVERVLVDNDQPVLGFGNQIRVMNLQGKRPLRRRG